MCSLHQNYGRINGNSHYYFILKRSLEAGLFCTDKADNPGSSRITLGLRQTNM